MQFKRIEMQGFKSFADPVTIELNNGITCIIGPNGSGKSNISDALRWVLGEQSPKQLRGGKMQEVIFAGTATRKPKGMAEVTLVVDNTSRQLPIEYNEVAVTRRMYRSGESEYLINGNQCRLKDIKELFMDTGIGVDGYSIIGQGKIADIVSNKADDRRAIFEEAAGVVMYKSRKTDAENKLKSANENLERVRDIIAEIEGRIGGLKEDSEKATEYIGLRDRYRHLGINVILHNLDSLARNVEIGRADLEALSLKYEEARKVSNELDDKIESLRVLESELSGSQEDANAELLAKIDELNTISNRGQVNTERLSNIEKDLERLNQEIADVTSKLEAEKAAFAELEVNEQEINNAKDEAEKLHAEAVAQYNEHVKKANIIDEEIEKSRDLVIDLTNKNVSRNAEIRTLSNYQETLINRRETLKNESDGRGEENSAAKAKLDDLTAKLEDKEALLKSIETEGIEINNKIVSVNQDVADASKIIDELGAKLNRAQARKNTIEEMEHNYEGYNNAVRTLMNKSFGGIIGTVSDLITVPDGYETAIETALGAQMQNIVCEDDKSAKSAISYLKSSKAGRATFLPVKSIRASRLTLDSQVVNANGYIDIASDVIKTEGIYKEIADYLLGRVILADNMDNAIAISKLNTSGFRIVTLEGEVINSSGAITGGRYTNKSANLLDRKKEIQTLAQEIDNIKAEIESKKESRQKGLDEIMELKNKRNEYNDSYQQLAIEYNVAKTDKDHAYEQLEAINTASDKYEAEIVTIGEDIERASAMIDKYQEEIKQAEKDISDAELKATELMDESEKYKSILEEDNETIVAQKISLSEYDTRILSQNELIERVRDTVVDLEDALSEYTDNRDELENTRNLLTSSGQASDEKENKLKEEKAALEEKINSLMARTDQARADYEAANTKRKETALEFERLSDEKYKLELKNTRNETLLDTQKEKLWDEFEVSYAEACDMREENFAITASNRELKDIKLRMAELGDVNISSIEEYKQVSKRYEFMTAQEADTTKAMNELKDIISNMEKTIRLKFKETFDEVVVNFEATFKELFGGGYAELTLEDENDPLQSGIEITAQPPGKKLKNINLLSGGEKTLTAIALMFAVLKAKPTPFCILDEVEAALDEVNIERFSDYLRNFSNVQFALITHQKATMEHADILYGVTMPEQGISRMLSLKMGEEFDAPGLS